MAAASALQIEVKAWHGINGALLMTMGIIIVGTILYLTFDKWRRLYRFYPETYTLDNLYELVLVKMESASRAATNWYMTGSLRDYLVYILGFTIALTGGAALLFGGVAFDFSQNSPVHLYEIILLGGMVIAALTVMLAKSRLTSVIAVGTLGFLVVFFLFLRAQLAHNSVETVLPYV